MKPEAAQLESVLLRRYVAGEHAAVYEELHRERAHDDIAFRVASEAMRRVRANLELLAERWRRLGGVVLAAPFGPNDSTRRACAALEKHVELPTTLRAFYREIGFVDFAEPVRGIGWPSFHDLAPLQIFAPPAPDEMHEMDEEEDGRIVIPLFTDNAIMAGYGGPGKVGATIHRNEPAFDCELTFENETMGGLVPYLRTTIFVGGGMGMSGMVNASERLLRELTRDLASF